MQAPYVRLCLAALLVGLWLALLFAGWVLGGAIHLLLVTALVLFPWRRISADPTAGSGSPRRD